MNSPINMTKDEIIDLLNRSWMTHDGMWFYHCLQECGIEIANRVNKAAIRSLAPIEMARMKKALCIKHALKKCLTSNRNIRNFRYIKWTGVSYRRHWSEVFQ